MGRIIVFTGKGGVGKTSVAGSHALRAAKEGLKTLIISTDMAHNLSDLFETKLGNEATEVYPKLFALEIDPNHEMQRHYGTIKEAIDKMLFSQKEMKLNEAELEDLVVIPGMEEFFSLLRIQEIYEKNEYDIIIVDCAPTGETLSLLKFPELFSWYMEKLFPVGKVALKVLRPISKHAFKLELPDSDTLNDIEKLYINLNKLQSLLKDRTICSIRLVTIPEKMVVEETKRNYMYLNLYNFNVDGIFINRIIPDDVEDSFFEEWKRLQREYLEELKMVFGSIPIYFIKWYNKDINGIEALESIVQDSLVDEHLLEVLKTTANEVFEKTKTGYKLTVYVPFVSKQTFDLFQSPTDLIIKVGNFKRNIPLPLVLRKYQVAGAKFEEGKLHISFSE